MWVRRHFLCLSLIILADLLSGCADLQFYGENRTVGLPSRKPIPPTTGAFGVHSSGASLHNWGKPFQFIDPKPTVLVFGHVEIRRDGELADVAGTLLFEADAFETNFGFFDLSGGYFEAVTFVSGDWFAAQIYMGSRQLWSVTFEEDYQEQFTDNKFPDYKFIACGSTNAWFANWETVFEFGDSSKAYYIGHITFNLIPFEFWPGANIEARTQDGSDLYADEIRELVGEQDVVRALFPNCNS